ncbi:hypothetical protein SAMN05216357_111111 [Porphyromonadaceae bacterium KH3CP3RA]|nr:hypothetical protein SAMN05216357_111111 [Porphyromonadaceae bacterium KH3CP3RA]
MKKLTKKRLDELASNMLTVTESEQQNLVGGSFYFDHSGNFIGQYGSGNDIIIANSILHSGIPLSIAPPETVGNVLTTMARAVGISGNVNIVFENGNLYGRAHSNGQVDFNYNANIMAYNNYYDFLSVLHHENHHLMTLEDAGTSHSEYQALIYEINQSSFQYTSDYYRDSTMNLYNFYHSGGYSNY